ncbi:uncharacterized protein LOC144660727 [Oculina patagonica]
MADLITGRKIICSTKMLLLLLLMWNENICVLSNSVLPRVKLPAFVVRALPGYRLTCSATGTGPFDIKIKRNSSVLGSISSHNLFNKIYAVTIRLDKEGNYSCVATNKYGTDERDFLVVFADCGPPCNHGYAFLRGNFLSCHDASPKEIIQCASTITNELSLRFLRNISNLPVGIFSNFPNLRQLDLGNSNVENLAEKIFSSLTYLQILYLSSNAITVLPKNVFANLVNLKWLHLSSNAITAPPEKVFDNLGNLTVL